MVYAHGGCNVVSETVRYLVFYQNVHLAVSNGWFVELVLFFFFESVLFGTNNRQTQYHLETFFVLVIQMLADSFDIWMNECFSTPRVSAAESLYVLSLDQNHTFINCVFL